MSATASWMPPTWSSPSTCARPHSRSAGTRRAPEVEALLHRERYRRLHELLTSGRVEIRVVPKDRVFIHGKAGVIEAADGTKTCFLGSINETKSAFAHNYEILWEDPSPEGVAWVEEEFEALWDGCLSAARRHRRGNRAGRRSASRSASTTPRPPDCRLPPWPRARSIAAASSSSPGSAPSSPCSSQHRETYGKARLLLADEVGVGKTLSLAASAMISALLGRRAGSDPLPVNAHAAMAGGTDGQARHPERGLVVDQEGLARPRRAR